MKARQIKAGDAVQVKDRDGHEWVFVAGRDAEPLVGQGYPHPMVEIAMEDSGCYVAFPANERVVLSSRHPQEEPEFFEEYKHGRDAGVWYPRTIPPRGGRPRPRRQASPSPTKDHIR